MPNDPLALILAVLPDEADYDAVHAALMATERGRRFLTEYADRNRHADTAMIVGAIARVEAAIRSDGAPRANAAGDLMEIAAAIDRIEAALTAGTTPASDVSAAIERLHDIAFMLHERPVEATLCDGLDAAIRDVSEASARSTSAVEGARNAAELLQALAGHVRAMVARAANADQPSGENVGVDSTSGAGFFELATNDGETFAQAVAELAASLPTLADAPSEPAEAAPEPESGQGGQTPAAEIAPSDDTLLPAEEAQQIAEETGDADNAAAPPQPASTEVSLSEAVLSEAFSDVQFTNANFSREGPAREEIESEPALSEEPPSEAEPPGETELPNEAEPNEAEPPARNFSTEAVADQEQDPADLFEPQPVPTPAAETAAPVTTDVAVPVEEPPRAVPVEPARAIPRPPGSDPLAAIRDLSEEELIALFS
jgi:hypothetical protein